MFVREETNQVWEHSDASTATLIDILAEAQLEDVGECLCSGKGVTFTHFQSTSHARLDRVYVSAELIPSCHDYRVTPVPFSDHCLVSFSTGKHKRNNKRFSWELWKFNVKLLKDEVFNRLFIEAIEDLATRTSEGWGHKWELFKQTIKLKALERASTLRHAEKELEARLRDHLHQLIAAECTQAGTFSEEMKSTKQKLELIDQERYRGAIIRPRAENLFAGEMPTKRALGAEKRYACKNEISEIDYKGATYNRKEAIAGVFFEYYKVIYTNQCTG